MFVYFLLTGQCYVNCLGNHISSYICFLKIRLFQKSTFISSDDALLQPFTKEWRIIVAAAFASGKENVWMFLQWGQFLWYLTFCLW